MSSSVRQLREVIVDYNASIVLVDGTEFPYLIADGVHAQPGSEECVPVVTVTLLPQKVIVVGRPTWPGVSPRHGRSK